MKKLDLVYICWDDHHFASHWQDADAIEHIPAKCHSIGWLLKEDEYGVTIVGTCTDDGDVGNAQYILKHCITNRRPIKRAPDATIRKARNGKQAVAAPATDVSAAVGNAGIRGRIVHGES